MRILLAAHHDRVVGGTERYLQALLPALIARGHHVGFLYETEVGGSRALIAERAPDAVAFHARPDARDSVQRAIEAWRPDLVFTHGLSDPALEAQLIADRPSAMFAHGYYGTCASGIKRMAFPQLHMCQRRLGPVCLAAYFPRRCGGLNPISALAYYRLQCRRHELLERYGAIIVGSRHMQSEFRRHVRDAERVHVVPLFPPDIEPEPEAPKPRELRNVVLFASRFTALKGGEQLIDAIARVKANLGSSLKLFMVGDGPLFGSWTRHARRCEIATDFVGWVERRRLVELMRASDVLAVPSLWPEPFGLVGIEGGCVGLPAVAYDVGGISEWLEGGLSGELAPGNPPTIEGLADAISRALGARDYLQRLRVGAWQAAQRFTRATHLDGLEPILRSVAVGNEARH